MKCVTRWYLSALTLAMAVCQMRHDGVMVINCSDYPIYANMTYTVDGVEHCVVSHVIPKFNKLAVVKYPLKLDNYTVNVTFYVQPRGKGDFQFRGQVSLQIFSGECYYINPPQVDNPYRLCELEKILTGSRTCPDQWYLDDNYYKKTLPSADTTAAKDAKAVTRAPGKTTKEGGPAGKTAAKAITTFAPAKAAKAPKAKSGKGKGKGKKG